jgi:hypothetical protein
MKRKKVESREETDENRERSLFHSLLSRFSSLFLPRRGKNRADQTTLELFQGGVRDWDVGLQMRYGIMHRH